MTVDTAKLRELIAKATPGPWIADNNEGFSPWSIWERMTPTGHGKPGKYVAQVIGDCAETDADAELISTSRNALPTLLDALDRKEAEVAEAKGQIEHLDRENDRLREALQWISVDDRLPEPGVTVVVYSPPQPDDYPDDVRVAFDAIDPESEGDYWMAHGEHYEHWCCVAKGGDDTAWRGPSEKAPYTHWMPLPAAPSIATQTEQREA